MALVISWKSFVFTGCTMLPRSCPVAFLHKCRAASQEAIARFLEAGRMSDFGGSDSDAEGQAVVQAAVQAAVLADDGFGGSDGGEADAGVPRRGQRRRSAELTGPLALGIIVADAAGGMWPQAAAPPDVDDASGVDEATLGVVAFRWSLHTRDEAYTEWHGCSVAKLILDRALAASRGQVHGVLVYEALGSAELLAPRRQDVVAHRPFDLRAELLPEATRSEGRTVADFIRLMSGAGLPITSTVVLNVAKCWLLRCADARGPAAPWSSTRSL